MSRATRSMLAGVSHLRLSQAHGGACSSQLLPRKELSTAVLAPLDGTTSEEAKTRTRGRLRVRRDQAKSVIIRPRAILPGINHAYDQALRLISDNSKGLKKELQALQPVLAQAEEAGDQQRIIEIQRKMHILEVQSEINLPYVRWTFIRGLGDMSRAVYRHLAEKKWREDGALDLMMERVYQMNVVPDLLPAIHPTIDVRLLFNEPPPRSLYRRTRLKRRPVPVEPGGYLLAEQTRGPPRFYVSAFHLEPRLYTLVMVDPDHPDIERQSFKTYLHWIIPNIPISATSTSVIRPEKGNYMPPHPQRGTAYHRLTLFLFQNPNGERLSIDTGLQLENRSNFDLRQFCSDYGFSMSRGGHGGGVFMWRQVWDETVSDIYENTLKLTEPVYGKPPKFDMYSEVKEMERYR